MLVNIVCIKVYISQVHLLRLSIFIYGQRPIYISDSYVHIISFHRTKATARLQTCFAVSAPN